MRDEFERLQRICDAVVALPTAADGGDARGLCVEAAVRTYLAHELPGKYRVSSGWVITSYGQQKVSCQCDIVVYDHRKCGPFPSVGLFPVEGVIAVVEAKIELDQRDAEKFVRTVRSVRSMEAYEGEYEEVRARTGIADNRPLGLVFAVKPKGDISQIKQRVSDAAQKLGVTPSEQLNFAIARDLAICHYTEYPSVTPLPPGRTIVHISPTESNGLAAAKISKDPFEAFLWGRIEMRGTCTHSVDLDRYRACKEFAPLVEALAGQPDWAQ